MAFDVQFNQSQPCESIDGHEEVGGKQGDHEGHGDLAKDRLVQFRQSNVGDQSQDQEYVGNCAADRIGNASNASLKTKTFLKCV